MCDPLTSSSAVPSPTNRFVVLCKLFSGVRVYVVRECIRFVSSVRTMWTVSEDGTIVGDSHGKILHLSTFGPRVRIVKFHASDACELRIENKFSHRVAFRWRQMAGSSLSTLKLSKFEGILLPRSGITIECIGEASCVKYEIIFAYADKAFGASHADTADEFWSAMEKNSVMHLCFRKKITIRRVMKPEIESNGVSDEMRNECKISEHDSHRFDNEPQPLHSALEAGV